MTEQEYKDYIYEKANKVETIEQLEDLINEVLNYKEFDYGTIIYAISGCMVATANCINRSSVGGITGFQASFIAWEMIRNFMICDNKCGMKIINYDDMLYPQYEYNFDKIISKKVWKALQEKAKEKLNDNHSAHPSVIAHWQSIINGEVPFGYKVEEE